MQCIDNYIFIDVGTFTDTYINISRLCISKNIVAIKVGQQLYDRIMLGKISKQLFD